MFSRVMPCGDAGKEAGETVQAPAKTRPRRSRARAYPSAASEPGAAVSGAGLDRPATRPKPRAGDDPSRHPPPEQEGACGATGASGARAEAATLLAAPSAQAAALGVHRRESPHRDVHELQDAPRAGLVHAEAVDGIHEVAVELRGPDEPGPSLARLLRVLGRERRGWQGERRCASGGDVSSEAVMGARSPEKPTSRTASAMV